MHKQRERERGRERVEQVRQSERRWERRWRKTEGERIGKGREMEEGEREWSK